MSLRWSHLFLFAVPAFLSLALDAAAANRGCATCEALARARGSDLVSDFSPEIALADSAIADYKIKLEKTNVSSLITRGNDIQYGGLPTCAKDPVINYCPGDSLPGSVLDSQLDPVFHSEYWNPNQAWNRVNDYSIDLGTDD